MTDELKLYEEVMLLALRDDKGTIETGAWYSQAASGAVLAELVLAGRIGIVPEGKSRLVQVLSEESLGDALADEWLERIAADKKTRKVGHWVNKISDTHQLKQRIANGLVERGILRLQENQVLWVFSRNVYPEMDPAPEQAIRARLRAAVLEDGEVDARTSVLLSLTQGTGLIQLVFDKHERKQRRDRIDQVVNGEVCGKATRELVEAMNATIVLMCIIPAISN